MSRPKPSELIRKLFADKLSEAMGELSATELATRLSKEINLDISYQAISNYLKAESVPKSDVLYGLSQYFSKPMGWFFGEELPTAFEDEHGFVNFYDVRAANGVSGIVAGDYPEVIERLPFKWRWLNKHGFKTESRLKRLAVIRASGDSMQTTINDGEVVLVDLDEAVRLPESIKNGSVYLLRWGVTMDELSIKRVHLDWASRTIMAASDNPLWKPKEITIKDGDDLRHYILGRVIWVGKEYL